MIVLMFIFNNHTQVHDWNVYYFNFFEYTPVQLQIVTI